MCKIFFQVYINKCDVADAEMVELVEMEIRELLNEFGTNKILTEMGLVIDKAVNYFLVFYIH